MTPQRVIAGVIDSLYEMNRHRKSGQFTCPYILGNQVIIPSLASYPMN